MATTLNMQLLLRRGVFSDSFVLAAGEPGYDTSTKVLKIGDGSTEWSKLGFANQSQIEELIKAVDDKIKALDATYATDAEVAKVKSDLEAALSAAIKGVTDTFGDIVTHNAAEFEKAGAADAVRDYVGEIPTTATATNVIAYIQEKTAGIATDTALEELTGRVTTAEGDLDDLQDALDAYKGEMTQTLAGKQDVIPENTYDAHGAADQALTAAKAYVDAEDVFETDMLTVNAHGGVAAGTDLNGLTTHEILKKILYPYVEPTLGNATASPNGGTYENGVTKTITSVSISVTKKSEAITSVALYNGSTLIEEKTGDAVKNGGTITFSDVNVEVPTNGNQLTVKVTDAANKTYEKKTSSMTFVYPYYIGSCAAGTAIDEALVESLTKKVESKGNKSNSFTVSDGHMVFAYPKSHGALKSILDPNNFETIGNYTRSEVSVTGLDGTTQTYYVYVSGATTVSSFAVNFKY
jgi:hypothetical protein